MIYQKLAELEKNGEEAVLCTVVSSKGSTPRNVGSKMLVYPDERIEGTVGGGEMESRVIEEALTALEAGKPRTLKYAMADPSRGDPGVCGGTVEIYVEPVLPAATLVVVGCGHVGQAVASLAKWLDYRVVASDDRLEYCTPEAMPDADEYLPGPLAQLPDEIKINRHTHLVLTTRNVMIDVGGLPALLDTPAAYIGVIGSKRRWRTTREKLVEAGVPANKLDRVVSPMGLEINAETPEEIAVSIMAEIIMLRRGGDGGRMAV